MIELSVGKQYPCEREFDSDGINVELIESGFLGTISFFSPTKREINQIENGQVRLAISVVDGIFFFLFKFGTENWMDAPFDINLYKNAPILEHPKEKKGYPFFVTLVDRSSKIIKAIRFFTSSTEFSRKLYKKIEIQKQLGLPTEYDQRLFKVYSKYDVKTLVSKAEFSFEI